MSKLNRFLSLFSLLLFTFCFLSFGSGVRAYAASDNLINSDITQWDVYSGVVELKNTSTNYQYFKLNEDSYIGIPFDKTSLIAGHSYTFSFSIPNNTDISSSADVSGHYDNGGFIQWYIGSLSHQGSNLESIVELVTIDESNIDGFKGRIYRCSFVCPSYEGTPVIAAYLRSPDGTARRFYVGNLSLIDNDDNSAELTGIKGFLHSIRWDLVGGVCEEEDCPHSTSDNPHTSLTERITAGFSSMFDKINGNFEDGSSLSSWFSDLGTSIRDKLTTVKEDISSSVNSIGESISGAVDNAKEAIDNVKDAIQIKIDELKQSFKDTIKTVTDWFDKFKPRVFFDFNWITRCYINSLGVLTPSSDRTSYSSTSDIFTVPEGSYFKVDYFAADSSVPEYGYAYIYKYDSSGKFLGRVQSRNFKEYALDPGYQYRFMFRFEAVDMTQIPDLSSYSNNIFKVYCDEGWINALIYKLKLSIRGLFVPDESVITDLKNDLDEQLEEHFGIIYTCSNLFGDLLTNAFDILNNAPNTYEFRIPAVYLPINGQNIPIFPGDEVDEDGNKYSTVDFSFMEKPVFKSAYNLYTVALYVLFGGLEVKYAMRVYRRVMDH